MRASRRDPHVRGPYHNRNAPAGSTGTPRSGGARGSAACRPCRWARGLSDPVLDVGYDLPRHGIALLRRLFCPMPRSMRSFCPGAVFHVTARIQCREPLLVGLERSTISIINQATDLSDAKLVAYVVMPNHIHLVLQQGLRPLGHYMQPLLRRIALLVQREHSWGGHVFERRYRDSPCLTAEYLRNAITYVHLNGVRACLAESPDTHEWSSHSPLYSQTPSPDSNRPVIENVLRVFAARTNDSMEMCRENYRGFVKWRLQLDAHRATEHVCGTRPDRPTTVGGDEHWSTIFATRLRATELQRPLRRIDLRDLALIAVREVEDDMNLETLRSGGRSPQVVRVRRHVISRAKAAGHRVTAIARFLSISPTTVSLTP